MKKTLILLLVFGLAFAFVSAQSITITSPVSGNNWSFGESGRVTWTQSGEQNELVKIRLFNEAGVRILSLANRTDNDGLFEWTVPATIPAGNYMIRVKTIDDLVTGNSSLFSIGVDFVSTGRIEVVTPNSSTSFYTTRVTTAISWNDYGELHENVSITVFSEGTSSRGTTIIESTPNDGEFSWNSPASTIGVGRYYIRVKTLDGAVWGDSDIFEILPTTPPLVQIDVTGPDTDANWNVGSPRMIYWRVRGEMDDRVKIELYNHTGLVLIRTLFANTENDESEHWIVPGDHDAGRFVMKVTTIDNEETGTSGIFNITRPDDPEEPRSTPLPVRRATMKIKFPNKDSVWKSGQKGNIVWANNSLHRRVRIELFKKGAIRPVNLVSGNTANDGNFVWNIPAGILSGKYKIKVTTADNAAYGLSEIFVIKSGRILFKKK